MGFWTVLSITTVLFCAVFSTTLGTKPTTYVIPLLGQDIQDESTAAANIEYELVIVNEESYQLTVSIININGNVTTLTVVANGRESHKLGHEMALSGSEFSNKSLEIISDTGRFVLQVFSKRNGYVEGLLAIPIQDMEGPNQVITKTVYEYVVATFCAVGGYCQIAIAAAENNTEVFIDIPKHVEEITLCNKTLFFRTHRDTKFTMNKFEALQLETTQDLTGTVIFSFKPIAVFAGSRNVTNGDIVAHTMEQLVPSSHWGTEFVVQTLGSNGYGDILKIVSHYTSTMVTMSGFPSFNMTERYQTVTRRLSKGTRSHIHASHPIQVVQISGLSYATMNESSTLSMTVVPSVQNAWNKFTVSCHDMHTTTTFLVVSEKTACTKTSAGGHSYLTDSSGKACYMPVFESRIKYSKYLIGTIVATETDPVTVSNHDSEISGIVKCDETVTMPLGILYNTAVIGTTPFTVPEHPGGICYEGGKATSYNSPSPVPYMLDFTKYYRHHVLKLRVQVCGTAVLRFTNPAGEVIVANIHNQGIDITSCDQQCRFINSNSYTADRLNDEAGIDCKTDMSFFWVMQDVNIFCIGTGYNHKKEMCIRDDTNIPIDLIRIHTDDFFNAVSMTGQFSDATFNWDFIFVVGGCREYEPGWRCVDKFSNCSQYEVGFCSEYHDFASINCAKSCGICFADSYGHKFLLKTPFFKNGETGECFIHVTPLNPHTHIAVTMMIETLSEQEEVILHGSRDSNDGITYHCPELSTLVNKLCTITILSDDDVAAILYLKKNGKLKGTRLYPVDAFGNEFMILEHSQVVKECNFISEEDHVKYVTYYSINKQKATNDSVLSDSLPNTVFSMPAKNDMSGMSFMFTRSSSVFCFDTKEYIFTQLLPVNSWANEYVVPGFDIDTVRYSLKGMLHILSTADNTIVNISGAFDAIHIIYNRGDKVEQEIDITAGYKIKASARIAVGLYINDATDIGLSSYSLLVPVQNHHDTIVTSVPYIAFDDELQTESEIYTSFINFDLNPNMMKLTEAEDAESSYRVFRTGEAIYEMTLVLSGNMWLIIPGNIKARYLNQLEKKLCGISTSAHEDGQDNDCDGLIDEDGFYSELYGIYKEDLDLDGDFGEDYGGEKIPRSVIVSAPKQPICFNFTELPGQCSIQCKCPCIWLKNLEKFKNLSYAELVEALSNRTKQIIFSMKLNKENLSATIMAKESAEDERKSARSIGFMGLAMFAIIFGTVLIMDIHALKRDALILLENLYDVFESLSECASKYFKKKETETNS